MSNLPYKTALIVGAGVGISASVARALKTEGLKIGLAARNIEKLKPLAEELGASRFAADASDAHAVASLFERVDAELCVPDVVVYNAAARVQGPLTELDPSAVRGAMEVAGFGGFRVVQQAAIRMVPRQSGAILITGATASVRGFARSAGFAMGMFALRGLAQSAARELGPQGIHVVHFVTDGGVRSAVRPDPEDQPDSTLDPDDIARNYLAVLAQSRSAWSSKVEQRPWVEKF